MPPGWISRAIGSSRQSTLWVVLLILVTGLGPAANVSSAGGLQLGVHGQTTAAPPAVSGQARQYHGRERPQYQERLGLQRPIPRGGQTANGASELKYRLLSTPFHFYFAVSHLNQRKLAISRLVPSPGAANGRSIVPQIPVRTCIPVPCISRTEGVSAGDTRNERLMLQLGGLVGVAYLVVLVFWYWATRFRPRPPRSAHT
jgi:hypothetical protein